MRKLLSIFIALAFALGVSAKQYGIDNIQMVHLLDSTRYVCNPCNVLSWEHVAVMDQMLDVLEDSTGIEVVVIAVDSLANHDCYETAIRIGQKYGVGKKSLNNGLVILLSTVERCVQFSTGSGLEGVLPDVICKRIQRECMIPYFSRGEWSEGMLEGVKATYEVLQGSMTWSEEPGEDSLMDKIFVLFFFLFLPVIAIREWWKSKKCPNCGKHKLTRVETLRIYEDSHVRKYQDIYLCKACGDKTTRLRTVYKESHSSRGGGFGGGFGGGGGFSGGHFGGGHFGGGGAGSRF